MSTIVSGDGEMLRLQYSRLCCLIHNSLHPFTAKSTESITKEQEKSLLITLSQVSNQIKLWTDEFASGDHGNPVNEISSNSKSTIVSSICHSSASECVFKIINELVFLLAIQSPYVRHLSGNVLVAISNFVVSMSSENHWEEFIKSLCIHFKLIIHKAISPSSNPPKTKHLDHDSSASSIILVLRNILKHLKHEEDDEILEVYLNTLSSCLQDIPWESCNTVSNEFCGHLLQLFCSIVSNSDDKNPLILEIFNIFPRFLTWYQSNQAENNGYTKISQYIQHKILVLMMRLSSIIKLDCEMIVSWLNLIEKHFQDLLFESLNQSDTNQDDCLKDSPFLLDETCHHQHLQRRVVFLYLKCSFHLIRLQETKGFIAIHEWLKKHLVKCSQFAESFLQLYIHEDDMLFEVLLLLTDMPFCNKQQKDWTLDVYEKDIIVLLLDIFETVHLFHIFLSEIHYDHQVLLDYLISKDTGATCAEYLLRCLRIICDKWDSFLKFPICKEVGSQSSKKRRKVMNDSFETDHKNQKSFKEPFHDARDCLLLLKKSIESLHHKNLFPYNPKVLLKRLSRFQELCPRP
ncbi:unnamed protein product [Lactuca virosa]|uniref:Protein Lines C-terminal domain-containing protein n=1 Tax=Lactuca virosa TaxID=75947 RepID=A0AAU9M673_9ASTR|nr:unnamed protein product [Lactuca virosa]